MEISWPWAVRLGRRTYAIIQRRAPVKSGVGIRSCDIWEIGSREEFNLQSTSRTSGNEASGEWKR